MCMEMPTPCKCCGELFDLLDGNGCDVCNIIYCEKCLEETFDICEYCKD